MNYFENFSSNTDAGSANQHIFKMAKDEVRTGRIFYKISNGGLFNYSLLFSNIIDSTYMDGSVSHRNLVCDSWEIIEARVGKCKDVCVGEEFKSSEMANKVNNNVSDFKQLTFDGKASKMVAPGEFFCCDAFTFEFNSDDFLCLEITFKGDWIPYHEESQIPVYRKTENGWIYSKEMPFAGMVGCDREVKSKVCYLGDSITQGCGTTPNGYKHWSALLSKKLGSDNAYWNLGIGYARGNDAATDGAWLYKVKQNDVVIMCCGVNDIYHGSTEEQLIKDLDNIVNALIKKNVKIILQTIPPFDYNEKQIIMWKNANNFILNELSKKVDYVFDTVPHLQESEECPYNSKFGAHPDDEGCEVWAEALYKEIKHLF